MRNCAVCTHPARDAIDVALIAGLNALNQIAVQYGVSKFSLGRHKARHLMVLPPVADAQTVEQQINTWLSRAEELWAVAGQQSEVRSMAAAIGQGLRALEFSVRHLQLQHGTETVMELPDNPNLWSEGQRTAVRNYLDSVIVAMPDDKGQTGEQQHDFPPAATN